MSRPVEDTQIGRGRLLLRAAGAWRFAPPAPRPALRVHDDRLPAGHSDRLRQAVSEALARRRPPGAQIAVRRGGSVLWSACAGRVDRSDPVQPQDRFVLASTSKMATAAVVARLAEERMLGLDDPVATWLPELPNATRLTPRLLLAHRSGLREYGRDRALAGRLNGAAPDHSWSRREVIEAIVRLGAEREPDRRFAYRNSNFVVAAEVAERASGRDFEMLVQTVIAQPLGLQGFSSAGEVPGARLATPHLRMLGRTVDLLAVTRGRVPSDALGPVWGDGGIASSAEELARFVDALFGGELVRRETVRAMTARRSRMGPRAGYGLGVMIVRRGGTLVAEHDGLYFGWTASAGIDAGTGTTVAVVANVAGPTIPARRLAEAVRRGLPGALTTA